MSDRLHYSAPSVTLADVVLDAVRKLPGEPDAYFCDWAAERARLAGLPCPKPQDIHAALTALVETGRIHVQRLHPGCTRPPCADPTRPEARATPEIPPPPEGEEAWRGRAVLPGWDREWIVALTRHDDGFRAWFWANHRPGVEWRRCDGRELEHVLTAWALSAEGRAAHAASRAALLDVQREDAVHLADRRATEREVVREAAARAHHALHVADVTLCELSGLPVAESLRAEVVKAIRVVGDAHGALHRVGIAAVEPGPITVTETPDARSPTIPAPDAEADEEPPVLPPPRIAAAMQDPEFRAAFNAPLPPELVAKLPDSVRRFEEAATVDPKPEPPSEAPLCVCGHRKGLHRGAMVGACLGCMLPGGDDTKCWHFRAAPATGGAK